MEEGKTKIRSYRRRIRESDIEKYLKEKIEDLGGRAFKFVSPGTAGVPDRLILLPNGRACFAELKAPGKVPNARQRKRHDQLRALGYQVAVIDSKSGVNAFISMLQ